MTALAFSPDGSKMVTGGHDGAANLWKVDTGKLLATLKGHTDRIYAAAFSPDGARVATASGDATARLWDTRDGKEVAVLEGQLARARKHLVRTLPLGAERGAR